MNTKVVPGSLIATPSREQVAEEAADRIARYLGEAIRDRGSATIALSGGSTPKDTYALLAKKKVEWSKIQLFFVDERAVPPTSERSNYKMVHEALVKPAGIDETTVFRMQGEAADLAAEAKRYEEVMRTKIRLKKTDKPNLDLLVLGVGDDGHTASLFPGEPEIDITDKLVCAVPAKGEREARLTLTVPVLEIAKSTIILAVGESKHAPLERVWKVKGDVHETPARIVRSFKGGVTWIIDRAAGGLG
jgi:6-phosphogluconolactonase